MASNGNIGQMNWGAVSDKGMKRPNNQDYQVVLVDAYSLPGTDALLAVADGMGGHKAGEIASASAILGLVSRLRSEFNDGIASRAAKDYRDLLEEVILEVNADVFRASVEPETRGMGTTLTAAIIDGDTVSIGHVGDSRAYLLRNENLRQLTNDHSLAAEAVSRGFLTNEQVETHFGRNVLMRAIGTAPTVEVDTMLVPVETGDVILLCSDGLHGLVPPHEIADALNQKDLLEACWQLVERANELGGHDNVTAIAARR